MILRGEQGHGPLLELCDLVQSRLPGGAGLDQPAEYLAHEQVVAVALLAVVRASAHLQGIHEHGSAYL